MFVILAYDVGSKRVSKARKIIKKYLNPLQESVFEGHISEAKLGKLKKELFEFIDNDYDSVIIYKIGSTRFAKKDEIGKTLNYEPWIL